MSSRRTWWRLLAMLVALVVIAAACGDDDDDDEADAGTATTAARGGSERGNVDGELVVAALLPQTGDLSALGPPMFKGVELATKQINDAGGVLGKPIKVVNADDGGTSNNDLASSAVDRLLTTENVDTFVGPAGSSTSRAVIDKITTAPAMMCSPSNTGDAFTTIEDRGLYFRTAPPDVLQSQALAELIVDDGNSEVGIIALNDEYGQGFAGNLEGDLKDAGADVVANVAYDPKGTSFDADVKKVIDAGPEAVVVISFPDTGGRIINSMIQQGAGPDDVAVYITDGLQSNTLFEKVDPNNKAVIEGVRGTAPSSSPEAGRPGFKEEFEAFAPGTDTIFSAHAYDCLIVTALAAVAADSDDPVKIAEKMNEVTKDGEKCTSFADCKELLEDGEDIDYDGAAGPLDFVEAGEPGAGSYEVYTFGSDGTYKVENQVAVDPDS